MARAPAFGGAQQGGFSQPGGPQLIPSYGPAHSQAVLDQFEALTLGPAAPGQPGDAGQLWGLRSSNHQGNAMNACATKMC